MDDVKIEINNKVGLVKLGLKILGGLGTSKIINGIVQNNVITETTAQKASVWVAKFAIVNIVANAVEVHTDHAVDESIDIYHKVRQAIQEKDQQETSTAKGP
jgi:hypothetical protein